MKSFLGDVGVNNINISKKSRHAVVTLLDGSTAEELVAKLQGCRLLNTEVEVRLYGNENLLVLAHLPLNRDDNDLRNLLAPHGTIERCFLMKDSSGKLHCCNAQIG